MRNILKSIVCFLLCCSSILVKAETLTVYTYDSFTSDWGPGPTIKKAFEEECGCTLNFVALDGSTTILNRLRLEGERTKADVVLGLDTNSMYEAQKSGLIAKHGMELSQLSVPNGWNNSYFIPFDYGYFSFIYNSETLSNPPANMDELLNSKELRVIYQDPRTSTPGLGLMLWMNYLYKDGIRQAWKKLADKTVVVTKGWSEAYSLFLKGESDLVLSYTTSPAYHIIAENEDKYRAISFDNGNYLQVEVAAKTTTTKKNKLADQFLHFVLSKKFQAAIPTGNWMYPVTDIELPEGFKLLDKPQKALSFTTDEVNSSRKAWIREWRSVVSQ